MGVVVVVICVIKLVAVMVLLSLRLMTMGRLFLRREPAVLTSYCSPFPAVAFQPTLRWLPFSAHISSSVLSKPKPYNDLLRISSRLPSCPGVFLADIAVISVDWGLAILGVLQLVMAVAVMYALNPIGRKPLLYYGKYSSTVVLIVSSAV